MIGKLDLYRIFYKVGKCKSFSSAAKELYMTQPAVSQSIIQLEEMLDIRLFTRTSRGVNLTNEGKRLYEYVSAAINLIETGEKKLLDSKNLIEGELKIGVGDTISRYYLLPFLKRFHEKYPNIKYKISNNTTFELCDTLKRGEVDIAICNLPINDSTLEVIECIDIQDIFVCGNKYKSIVKGDISFEELTKLPLILLEIESNSRQYVDKFMISKGIKLHPEIELGSHDLLLDFAKINLGIACVVKEFSYDYLNNGDLYEVCTREKIPKRSIGICFLKGVSLSPASARFIEILKSREIY